MDTPVLFLIFNRPDTTIEVFEAIRKEKPKKLFIAADGPRSNRETDIILCKKTRDIVKNIDWECEVKTLFRDKNLGCKIAVSLAITWFFENVNEGIILEDDCFPNKSFFTFCECMLERYRDEEKIGMISGDNFVPEEILNKIDPNSSRYYFIRPTYLWGWATWKRAWAKYDLEMKDWPKVKKDDFLYKIFKNRNVSMFYSDIFQMTYDGRATTWDPQWFLSSLLNNMLCIIPPRNLISNIGIVGEHSNKAGSFNKMSTNFFLIENLKHSKTISPDIEIENVMFLNTRINTFNLRIYMIRVLDFLRLHHITSILYRKFKFKF